jgi:hypothetical protein
MRYLLFSSLLLGSWRELSMAQELTPRELFFSAPGSPIQVTRKAEAKPVTQMGAKPNVGSPAANRAKAPSPQPAPEGVGGAAVVLAAAGGPAPLGLRYSILLSREGADYREVDAESVFRSGDRLKIQVEANTGAYLYVVARGSSGNWSVLFPTTEVENGSNFVAPFRPYLVPATGRFYFDDQAGEEKLFLVLARKPEANLEDIIYKINTPAPTVPPGGKPPAKQMQLAQLIRPIDDQLVGRVRSSMVARDLVFEKVDETKPLTPERRETAAYVINRDPAPEAKLVVDLRLQHR